MTDTIPGLIARAQDLKTERSATDQHLADIAELVRPLRNELRGTQTPGNKRMANVFDSTGIYANANLAAGLFGTLTNPASPWLAFATHDPSLNRWQRVAQWLGDVSRIVLASAGPSWSQFYGQMPEWFLDASGLGTAVFYSAVRDDRSGFVDMTRSLGENYFDVDDEGTPNANFRLYTMSARAAERGFKGKVSSKLKEKSEKTPLAPVEILHAVMPNDDYEPERLGPKGMAYASVYIEPETKFEISRGGYEEFPFQIARWAVANGEKMGRGQGDLALADLRSSQVQAKANLKAGEFAADGPWGAPEEGELNNVRLRPGKIVYGAITMQGKQLVQRLASGVNVPFSLEQMQAMKDAIKDAFFFSIMQLVGRSGMTATEVLEKQEEKMRLTAPYTGRINTEGLSRWAIRRFNMLNRLGLLPPPPPELAGRSITVDFISPMALAQKSIQANAVMRAHAFMTQQFQTNPEVADTWNADAAQRIANEGFGAPADVNNPDDVVKARRDQRAQQMQMQQMLAAAQMGAKAAKDGAGALAEAQGAQQQQKAA